MGRGEKGEREKNSPHEINDELIKNYLNYKMPGTRMRKREKETIYSFSFFLPNLSPSPLSLPPLSLPTYLPAGVKKKKKPAR